MSQDPNQHPNPKEANPKKPTNWFLIWAIITAILTGAAVVVTLFNPELRCFIIRSTCPPTSQKLTLYTLTEDNKLLEGVDIIVSSSDDPPEKAQTDINGYAQITIANKGIVRVHLSKEGYTTQYTTIDLRNLQDTPRTIKFSASGEPEVSIGGPDTSIVQASPTPTPTPTIITTPATPSNTVITAVENDFMKMQVKKGNPSKNKDGYVNMAFIIFNKTNEDLYLALNWSSGGSTITDNFSQVCSGRRLTGLATLNSDNTDPNAFTLISPNTNITVAVEPCSFPNSTEFDASFPLIRYQPSTTSSGGENTRFSVGFTGLKLPEN